MSIEDLITRLEGATEGSRELDEQIAKAVGALPADAKFWAINPEDGMAEYEWLQTDPDDPEPYPAGGQGLNYTTSVDAALSLVPEGWVIPLSCGLHQFIVDAQWGWGCALSQLGVNGHGYVYVDWRTSRPPTPALAICIAALRARARCPDDGAGR